MAVVYRAVDPETNDYVAVKAVGVTRPLNLACFRREVHALRRMAHPGIVRIRDQGVDDGLSWCAMDLVEGTPFRRLFGDDDAAAENTGTAGAARPPRRVLALRGGELAKVLCVLQRLCAPLAFLHGEGIVHRDLKPENIVVRPDGTPVIVDFGLAARFSGHVSREEVSAEGHAELGTLGYMAPEQRRGELYDARVDIYAMGCMLYEALTGRLPAGAVRSPAETDPGVPPGLAALAMRLLAPDPRARLGYADSLASALSAFADEGLASAPPAKTYLYRPTFAGHEDALARLLHWVDEPAGGIALVRGESGVGKTRLVMEVARHAARRAPDGLVVSGECVPVSGTTSTGIQAAPLHPLRPVLRAIADHCRASGPSAVARILGKRLRVLAAYEPELLELATAAHPEPPELSPQATRARLFADLGETLALFAEEGAILLVIDDLQWSDELTLTFLVEHHEQLRGRNVRVVGTFRSEASGGLIERLLAGAGLVIDVHRLDARSVTSIVSDMLAMASPPEALVHFMRDHSEGNPFFVAEYLRAAVHEGWLERDRAGQWQVVGTRGANDALPLPRSLLDLVTQRLGGLSEAADRFVDACAVLGRDVEAALLVEILALDDAGELEIIAELLRRQVLEDLPEHGLRFSHDKLREVAYGRLGRTERRRLHERAAASLERARGDEPASFGVLAHHLLQAGLDTRAVDYLEKGGEHAIRTAAHGQARQLFDRALALPVRVDRLRRSRWMRRVAEAAFGQGDIEDSERRAAETMKHLTGRLPSGRLGWGMALGRALVRQGIGWTFPRTRGARSEAERAHSLEAALVAGQLASIFYFTGDAIPMVASLLMGVNLADRASSPSAVVESHARLAYISGVAGVHRAANHYFDRASKLANEQANASGRALTLYLHAFYQLGIAEWAHAEHQGREALKLLLEIGDRQDAEIAQTIAAHAVFFSGRLGDARRDYEQVFESARGRGNRQHEAWGLFLLGRSDLAMGHLALAIDELERARALLPLADRFAVAICCGLLAQAHLARGDLRKAEGVASVLDELTRSVLPLAPSVHGYVGAADVRLAAAERDRTDGRSRAAARVASQNLARFARTFPMARAASLRVRARCDLLDDDVLRATRRLQKSVASAREHAMPYEGALSHALLSTVEAAPERARAHHAEAERLFTRIGAVSPRLSPR